MTMPHLMNCGHSDDGWCLDCVKAQHDELAALREAVEAMTSRDLLGEGYELCLKPFRDGVKVTWPESANPDPIDPLVPDEGEHLGTVTYYEDRGDPSVGMDGYRGFAFVPREGLVLVNANELAKLRATPPAAGVPPQLQRFRFEPGGDMAYCDPKGDWVRYSDVLALLTPSPGDAGVVVTDAEVAAWAKRHDLRLSPVDARAAFDDAASLHLARPADASGGEVGQP